MTSILKEINKNLAPSYSGAFLYIVKEHYLEILYKHHGEWVAIIKAFGEHFYAEDIVMETYIRIQNGNNEKKAIANGQVNRAFVWIALRNNYLNFARQKRKVQKVGLTNTKELTAPQTTNRLKHQAHEIIMLKIENEMAGWHWYDRDVFKLLASKEISMRKFSRDSKISLSSVANTMNKCKTKLRQAVGEDFEDFINGDFKQIKE